MHKKTVSFSLTDPCASIRLAVLTVSPKRQYRGIFTPTTPATTVPEWIPADIANRIKQQPSSSPPINVEHIRRQNRLYAITLAVVMVAALSHLPYASIVAMQSVIYYVLVIIIITTVAVICGSIIPMAPSDWKTSILKEDNLFKT